MPNTLSLPQVDLLLLITTVLSQWDFSHGKFGLLSPGESQLRQSRATQPVVHARWCFGVSVIHQTLTWTTGSFNVRTDVNACDCARGCTDTVRESALKVDSGRKIPCYTSRARRCEP